MHLKMSAYQVIGRILIMISAVIMICAIVSCTVILFGDHAKTGNVSVQEQGEVDPELNK